MTALKHGEEVLLATNPLNIDSDGDSYNDYLEAQRGSDPLDSTSLPTYNLALLNGGNGSGSVTLTPPGPAQTLPYTGQYIPNTQVTLTATADSTSVFGGWSGGGCTGYGNCLITMSGDKTVTAIFNSLQMARITGTTPIYYTTLTAAIGAASSGKIILRRVILNLSRT